MESEKEKPTKKFMGRIILKSKNHKLYGFDVETKEFGILEPENKEIVFTQKILFVQALNESNALRKFKKVHGLEITMKKK